ncbi:MAG TPA: shikimate kinase [Acidimicrobiia bacterium]
MHVVLVGEMGVGKTTVGTRLATRLGREFLDSDAVIEESFGQTGAEIAGEDGVARLHAIELETFLGMAGRHEEAVIAPAASVVDDARGRQRLAEQFTVWLVADPSVTAERSRRQGHRRPYDTGERDRLWEERSSRLEQIAAMVVDTGRLSPDEAVEEIVTRLEAAGWAEPADPQKLE